MQNLLRVSLLKSLAHEAYVTEVSGNQEELKFTMFAEAPVDPSRIAPMIGKYKGDLRVSAGKNPCFTYRDQRKRNTDPVKMLETVRSILGDLKALLEEAGCPR